MNYKRVIDDYRNGVSHLYDVYLCVYPDMERVRIVEKKINSLCARQRLYHSLFVERSGEVKAEYHSEYTPVTIRDYSDKAPEERDAAITSFIYAEQRRRYTPVKDYLINMHVIKHSEDKYIFVLSICDQAGIVEGADSVVREIFSNSNVITMDNNYITKNNHIAASSYWRTTLENKPRANDKITTSARVQYNSNLFTIDEKLSSILRKKAEDDYRKMKAIFITIWGYILSKYFNEEEIYLGDAMAKGLLSYAPIHFNRNHPIIENAKSAFGQMEAAAEYNTINLSKLEALAEFKTNNSIFMIQYMYDVKGVNNSLANLQTNTVYHMRARTFNDCALNLDYCYINGKIHINYIYKAPIFKDDDIVAMHKTFLAMLDNLAKSEDVAKEVISVPEVAREQIAVDAVRILNERADMLLNTGIFSGYSRNDLLSIAKMSHVSNYMLDDTIYEIAQKVPSLYIVMKGKVSVFAANSDNIVTPLYTIKEGEIFGMESILEDPISKCGCMAATDEVVLIEISAAFLDNLISRNPNILKKLLGIQTRRLIKFEKLWMMN